MSANARGLTLVELVMAIAMSGILVVALMSSYSSIVGRSSDPMIRAQALAIAESFLEEASGKAFLDPGTGSRCPAPEASRSSFNNVCDYNGYSASTITLPTGAAVSGLTGYAVAISVAAIASGELGVVPTTCALKITVAVTSPLNETLSVTGYRTDYESTPACS